MSATARQSTRQLPGGFGPPDTPPQQRQLPTRADIGALLSGDPGPVKTVNDARRWMETKGWILAGEPYDRTKLVRVLMTAAMVTKGTRLDSDARNAVLAVAFLLEDDVTDSTAETIAQAVAAKVLDRIGPVTTSLSTSVEFAAAASTTQAETTLALKDAATQLVAATVGWPDHPAPHGRTSLQPTARRLHLTRPHPPATFNPSLPAQHTRLQQRLLRDAQTVLIEVDATNKTSPQDRSPNGNHELRKRINKHLSEIDKTMNDLTADKGSATAATHTWIRGISALARGAYLLEFDTADSAERFRTYAEDPEWDVAGANFGETARVIDKAHNLIVRFVPCKGEFDPTSPHDLVTFEEDNNLPAGSVTSAT
ncbi:hypothetical protein C0992_003109 [Termitomyces sp. T32_za158]|nr:hypothetical protein C0992_003109 [Termitomyces sp. T32_za158]